MSVCPVCHAVDDAVLVVGSVLLPERHTVDDRGRPCPKMGKLAKTLSPDEAKAEKAAQVAALQAQIDALEAS